jgi:hypothetical protein
MLNEILALVQALEYCAFVRGDLKALAALTRLGASRWQGQPTLIEELDATFGGTRAARHGVVTHSLVQAGDKTLITPKKDQSGIVLVK